MTTRNDSKAHPEKGGIMKVFKMLVTIKCECIKNIFDRYPSLPRSDDGIPYLYDYMCIGYFEDIYRELSGLYPFSLPMMTKRMAYDIFIEDRINPMIFPEGWEYQVDREKIPAGSTCSFTVMTVNTGYLDLVKECFGFKHPDTDFGDITEVEISLKNYISHKI
jgi:hypothetical protein